MSPYQPSNQSQPLTKSDLLKWVSNELCLTVNNILRFQSGTLFVLLLIKVYQNDVLMLQLIQKQANLKAKSELEFIQNFKLIFKIVTEQS